VPLSSLVIALVSVGCASRVAVAPAAGERTAAGASPTRPARVVEAERAPERDEAAADDSKGERTPREAATRTRPEPATVEGEVFAHCAYGPPNYGEDPGSDSRENFALFVLDKPLPQVCPSEPGAECISQVVMFHVSTLSEEGLSRPEALVGRHVKFSVSEYQTAETGHHHSRIILWYDGVEDLGVASRRSLRSTWAAAKADFLGISCQGFPH
jgi:hypothetical protein